MTLSIRIRTSRLRARLSQNTMATQLGVSRTAVANWESGSQPTRPSSKRLEGISKLTNVSWEWLATGRGQIALPACEAAAADAELVEDPVERRLLEAFRAKDDRIKMAVLTLLETSSIGR